MTKTRFTIASQPAAVGRRVFVSYSHDDARLAQAFHKALKVLAESALDLGLAPDRIFFDTERLVAGDRWSAEIESALKTADIFLLLVSIGSLGSRYCMVDELGAAVAQGKLIVPVLLGPTPSWEQRPLPGHPEGLRLGDLQGVPSVNGRLKPVSGGNWANQNEALTAAMDNLTDRLRARTTIQAPVQTATATAAAAGAAARPLLPPLLPNLCNQTPAATSLETRLDDWPAGKALMVLLKGEIPDNTYGFWARVRANNLDRYCTAILGRPLHAPQPLTLPTAADAGGDAALLRSAVLRALTEALTGVPRPPLRDEALAALLTAEAGVRLLEVSLPQDTPEGIGAALQALLGLLDEATPATPLERLVVGVLCEDPALVAEDHLVQRLGLAPARTCVIETRRLQPLSVRDVRNWHRAQKIEPLSGIDEELLILQVFGDAEQLRHLTFDQRVRPLLGLARQESAR